MHRKLKHWSRFWKEENGNGIPRSTHTGTIVLGATVLVFLFMLASARSVVVDPPQSLKISEHATSSQVAHDLHALKIIRHEWPFRLMRTLTGANRPIKAGTHVFGGRVSLGALWRALSNGTNLLPDVTVTIPEGLRSDQIAKILEQKGVVSSAAFLQEVRLPTRSMLDRYPFLSLKPRDQGLEGFLFGDTYRFLPNSTASMVVTKFLDAFNKKIIRDLYPTDATLEHLYSDLTLASIVEMEVSTPTDRKIVADIFKKRLATQLPLQADSTINYITGKTAPRSSLEDTLIASPYNTYRVRGFPPSPISNPSRWSIDAVLNSTPNQYFYFLTDADGQAHFAGTFAEHQTNRQKFLK